MKRHGPGWFAGKWVQMLTIGALALAPLGLTIWLIWLLAQLAAFVGSLVSRPVLGWLAIYAPGIEDVLADPFIATLIEIGFAIVILTLTGLFAGNFIGRQFGRLVNSLMVRIPIASVVYSSVRQLIQSFQSPAEAAKKVVLIEFPSEHMKTVGLVTRTFVADDTGEQLAVVYVPTTPNPTSGYVEIVPFERLVWLDWTTAEAIQFIVSAGVTAPDRIRYRQTGQPPLDPPPPVDSPTPPEGTSTSVAALES